MILVILDGLFCEEKCNVSVTLTVICDCFYCNDSSCLYGDCIVCCIVCCIVGDYIVVTSIIVMKQ